jgi:hypothetical protein
MWKSSIPRRRNNNSRALVSVERPGVPENTNSDEEVFYNHRGYTSSAPGSLIFEPGFGNYTPVLPAAYVENKYYDPQVRQLVATPNTNNTHHEHGGAGVSYRPTAVSVFDVKTNPIQYLDTRLPLPTISSPARLVSRAQQAGAGGGAPLYAARTGEGAVDVSNPPPPLSQVTQVLRANPGNADVAGFIAPQAQAGGEGEAAFPPYCSVDIPSKELRHVREDMEASIADFTRWGRGAGDGEPLGYERSAIVVSGTALQNGPVAVSSPQVTGDLYDQGFISMSGVPMINVGVYKNPLTGVEYTAYESALPPPDADYEETLTAPARNVKLAHLQGGWTDNTPRPTKREVVEDDFHFQYDRSINSFGTYDPSRYVEMFERTNRFVRNDEHPDPDGPELDDVPTNIYQIRPLPYLPPTNRGKWGETTFRSGIDARVAVGNSQMQVDQTFTSFPCTRMENTRMDGGGMQVTQNTQAPMDTQMGGAGGEGRRDILPTQRSTTEGNAPYMAPASFVRLNANTGVSQYEPSTGDRGTALIGGQVVGGAAAHGATTAAGGLQHQAEVNAPNGFAGTQYVDASRTGGVLLSSAGSGGQTLRDAAVEPPTGFGGVRYIDVMQVGGGIQTSALPSMSMGPSLKRQQLLEAPHAMTGTQLNSQGEQFGASGGPSSFGPSTQSSSVVESVTKKGGNATQRNDYGASGGPESYGASLASSSVVESVTKKGGNATQRNDYGASGGPESYGQSVASSSVVENMTKKTGQATSINGTFAASYAYGGGGQQLTDQVLDHANSKSGSATRGDAYGATAVVGDVPACAPATAARTRFSSRKGARVDFLMPSGSISGTEGFEPGSQVYGATTKLTSKKEGMYDTRWGFSQVPDDGTVWYGYYEQKAERLNSRPLGNLEHAVAPAGEAFFMRQEDCRA